MPEILLSTAAPNWPWKRQTPGESGKWGVFNFVIDEPLSHADAWVVFESLDAGRTVCCSPDRLVFIAGEPGAISNYHVDFLKQFTHVVISQQAVDHPHVCHRQQGHPWFVERSFDELLTMEPVRKTKGVCVIVSDKAFTPGHTKRLEFVEALKERMGERLDVWGRGIADFESKWDLLKEYRYALVLENTIENDYLSEKLPDAWLAFCLPFYAGCPNLDRYYPDAPCVQVDLNDVGTTAEKLLAALDDESIYTRMLPEILKCRQQYLLREQFFPNLESILKSVCGEAGAAPIEMTIKPNSYFISNGSSQNFGSFLAAARNRIGKLLKLIR